MLLGMFATVLWRQRLIDGAWGSSIILAHFLTEGGRQEHQRWKVKF